MSKCKLETCLNPVTGRQIYCTDRCRQRARKTIPIRCHPLSRNLRITTEYHVEGEEAPPAIRARRRGLRVLANPCDGPCRTSSSVTPLHSCRARIGYQSELWKMVNERSTPYPQKRKARPPCRAFQRYCSPVVFAQNSLRREKVKRGKTGATKWH